jgi:hypothetical protein
VNDLIVPPILLLFGEVLRQKLFIVLKHGRTPSAKYKSAGEAIRDGALVVNLGVRLSFI